jgi:cytochrome c5
VARRVIRAAEEDLRRWIGPAQLDNDFLAALYLRVREAFERSCPGDNDAIVDDVALVIYLTASAWQPGNAPPLALLSSLHQVIGKTLEEENMKSRSVIPTILALLLVAALPLAAFGNDAAAVFKTRCAMCHGPDGSGNTPMGKKIGAKALGSPEVQKLTDAELTKTITAGKGKMPEFGTKIPAAQVTDLVKVVRGFAAK